MGRRQRSDSITAAVAVASKAGAQVEPPAHVPLTEADMRFWDSVIAEFARADWTAHQLELAAMLARDMADAERIQLQLRRNGETLTNRFGEVVANPLMASLRMKTTNILSFRRSLGVHARARDGDSRTTANKAKAGRQVERDVSIEDDLIARSPTLQ